MLKIAHIINPVSVTDQSDLFVAQPITFETMKIASRFASEKIKVGLFTTQFREDCGYVPEGFTQTANLKNSVLEYGEFHFLRKLPLIRDILDNLYEASDADYFVYTNVDIGLMPYFYRGINSIIEEGYDAFILNRRTISSEFSSVEQIPLMWMQAGEAHCGYDCFVFKRQVYKNYLLGTSCIGANRIGVILHANLRYHAKKFKVFDAVHMTFHIGDDQSWRSEKFLDYDFHNVKQLFEILTQMRSEQLLPLPWLDEFYSDCKERIDSISVGFSSQRLLSITRWKRIYQALKRKVASLRRRDR